MTIWPDGGTQVSQDTTMINATKTEDSDFNFASAGAN